MSKIPYSFTGIPNFLIETGWMKDPKTCVLFVYLFHRIRYEPHIEVINGREIHLEAFEFIYGRDSVATETGLSPSEVKTRMKQIVTSKMTSKVTNKTTSKYTVYKWTKEHFSRNDDQQNDQQSDQQNDLNLTSNSTTKKMDEDEKRKDEKDVRSSFRGGGNVGNSQASYQHSPPPAKSPFLQKENNKASSSLSEATSEEPLLDRVFARIAGFKLMDGSSLKNQSIHQWSGRHSHADLLLILDWFDEMQKKKFTKDGEILTEAYLQEGITQGWWKIWAKRKFAKEQDEKQAARHRRNL